jgi:structural maintenance of chromosome 1
LATFENDIKELTEEMERLAPNLRALSKMDEVEMKFKETSSEFEQARLEARRAKDAFEKIKHQRYFVLSTLCLGKR